MLRLAGADGSANGSSTGSLSCIQRPVKPPQKLHVPQSEISNYIQRRAAGALRALVQADVLHKQHQQQRQACLEQLSKSSIRPSA